MSLNVEHRSELKETVVSFTISARGPTFQQEPLPSTSSKHVHSAQLHLLAHAGCSFIDNASCSGCCCRRSTTSFHNSRSCFTRSSWDSMCCCEIWSRRNTLWSAFLAIMSRMLRKRWEQRWRQALSTRKDMFSAHSSHPRSSTSASL